LFSAIIAQVAIASIVSLLARTPKMLVVEAKNDTMEAMATWAIMAENNFLEALF
jgi:hypothetical protein